MTTAITDKIDDELGALDMRMTSHEAVCAERYKTIIERFEDMRGRFSNLEKVAYSIAAAIFLGMAVIIGKTVFGIGG